MARPYKRRKSIAAPFFRHIGSAETPGSTAVTVLSKNSSGVLLAQGETVPTDTEAGYAKGCLFIDTNAALGSILYVNEGTAASCDFNVVESAASVVTAVTAGEGLQGGGSSGSVTLDLGLPVYNGTGGELTPGTLVNISGYDTTNGLTVTLADADSNVPATAVVKDSIADTTTGVVYPIAQVDGLNTGGRTIGDAVYLSGTAGEFTFSAVTGSNQLNQLVGIVKVVDASVGEIEFFPGLGHWNKLGNDFLQDQAVGVNKLHTDARMNSIVLPVIQALPAPTGSNQTGLTRALWGAPGNAEIVGMYLLSDTATASSDAASRYVITARNITAAQNLATVPAATDSAEVAVAQPYDLGVDQNQSISNGNVIGLTVDIYDDGSPNPTDLSTANLYVQINYRLRA